ncbi:MULTISPECIES: FG-GAP-like repeat-containing protein [unclassified Streptomyces]|uniref:FG-GAP-like repeat-containing protein n=1 Tax=unclassified Streptomyces TaxID=2593676 RepID=UPI001BE92C58|nr:MULTISPECIES: FG-GAP-like repeat-containing protein [unclassified Streptomyces]MBT2407699.1 VCBS repeat-containing protein [Streptomyces sp. ISL-21]MBT2610851.1 VCBS repeat-containing protein [Streptomyces sp. ISL-87]
MGSVGTVLPAGSAAALVQPAAVTADGDDGSVSPEDKALAEAKATGHAVELTSARTELSDTWVNPDGTFSVKRYGAPVRVLRDGAWLAADPTLEFAADGSVKPKATSVVVSFSGGGTGPILTGVKDGRTLSLSWPTALPKPTLNGNVATYAEVLPGVDLQLKSEVEGFSQLVVVKTPQAAANPQLATLKYTMSTVGVTVSTDPSTGVVVAKNPAGQTVFSSPSPLMWDSTTTGSSPQVPADGMRLASASMTTSVAEAPEPDSSFEQPAGAKEAVMPTTVSGNSLQITPDQNLLTAADTTYPVYIDPSWAWGGRNNWTRVSKKYPTKNYLNANEVARVGYENETNGLSRSFFELDTSNVRGAKVARSTFRIKNVWSWSCQDRQVQLWHTGAISNKTTWQNQPAKIDWLYNVNDSKGWSNDCAAGNLEFDLTWKMQRVAAAGDTSITLGMYAADESDTFGWKKFDPKTAVLETVYNNPPQTPSGLGTNPKTDCSTGGLIGNTTVSLYALVTDPNAGNLSAQFQVFRDGTMVADEWIPGLRDRVSTLVVPDSKLPSGSYTWKVRAYDQSEYSDWSQTCKFTVDRTRPAKPPKISSTVFPNGDAGWPANTGKARTPGSFTLSPNGVNEVVWYGYYTDWDPEIKSVTVAAGTSANVNLTPPGVGPHFVYAFSQDPAGNRSDTATYLFYAGRSATRDLPGDLNGDGHKDIWSNDSFGTLLTYAGQGNAKFSSITNGGISLGTAKTSSSGDWGQDGYNDLVTLENDPVDKIDKLWSYPNNGFGHLQQNKRTQINVSCPVYNEELGCFEEGDDHWQGASQIVNPGDLNGDGRPDLLVKQGKRLWAYYGERNHLLDMHGAPVLVGGEDWDKYTVITPGDLNGDTIPDLWLRDNANGDILRSYGKKSLDGKIVDLATWGAEPRTKVGVGVTQAAYPEVGSAGDLSGDGVTDLWARQADNTMFGWYGQAWSGSVNSFSGGFQIDGVSGSRIPPGTTLASGQQYTTGSSKLVMQTDGNLVLYTKDNKPVWATNTNGNPGAVARMQTDGNFVVYTANGSTALWSSKTSNHPNSYAVLHGRGVLVIYDAVGRSQWTSGSQSRPDYNGDGYTDVLTRDANGDMWVYPGTGGTGTSTLGGRYFVGNGWWRDYWTNAYTADLNNDGYTDIVGRNRNGELHLYPGTGKTGTNSFGSPSLIGTGWNTYDTLGFGDMNGDGRTDVIGRDSGGDLWVYPHSGGTGTSTLGSRVFIGNGWWPASWTTIRFADLNGDYKIDIMGRTDGGDLYVYPNTTGSNGTITFGARYFNGNGWWNGYWNPFATDLNSDGAAESVGITNNGELYDFLPTGRTLIGTGWGSLDVIL